MRIITYSTKINRENNLTELVKEKAYNYKTENKHLDCAEKIVNNPVSMSPLSGDRKPQIRF